jgi:hypothetical protein
LKNSDLSLPAFQIGQPIIVPYKWYNPTLIFSF